MLPSRDLEVSSPNTMDADKKEREASAENSPGRQAEVTATKDLNAEGEVYLNAIIGVGQS